MDNPNLAITDQLVDALQRSTEGHLFWEPYLRKLTGSEPFPFSIHLAVLLEPYLSYILDGSKTVESRFSKHRIAPYRAVAPGDVVLLKKASARSISGVCVVSGAWFYQLDVDSWAEIKGGFARALRADDASFWSQRAGAHYATLMRISDVHATSDIRVPKRDRRGWVVLYNRGQNELGLSWEKKV